MNREEISQLLEKYYNGETSDAEELALKEFFAGKNVPDEFHADREIFSYFRYSSEMPLPSADFEKKIIAGAERGGSRLVLRGRRILLTVSGIAAGLVILAGSYYFFTRSSEPRDTFSDPSIAYAETMKILYGVSAQLNHATGTLEPVGRLRNVAAKSLRAVDRPARILENNLRTIGRLNRTVEALDMINNENKINKN